MQLATVRILSACVLAALSSGAAPAFAATDTTTFQVSATIAQDCNLSASNLSFGAYDASSGSVLDGSSSISVYCSNGTAYSVALSVGTGGGSFTGRTLNGGGGNLGFNLYTTAGRTIVWGDGTGATNAISGSGTGLLTAVTHTVYGRIAAGQDLAAGTYTSTITVTVTF
jgi:spore coat protein U-like protein